MAKKTVITEEFTDDIDGTASGVQTVRFAFDGKDLEIDLGKRNRASFEKAMKPYIDAARKTTTRPTRGPSRTRRTTTPKHDVSAIRTWATENGLQVSGRGRISREVTDAYNAAH